MAKEALFIHDMDLDDDSEVIYEEDKEPDMDALLEQSQRQVNAMPAEGVDATEAYENIIKYYEHLGNRVITDTTSDAIMTFAYMRGYGRPLRYYHEVELNPDEGYMLDVEEFVREMGGYFIYWDITEFVTATPWGMLRFRVGHSPFLVLRSKIRFYTDSEYHFRKMKEWFFSLYSLKKKPAIKKNEIFVAYTYNGSLMTDKGTIKEYNIDVKKNYNDDLPLEAILNTVRAKDDSGLVLLHGKPGTGKTMFLRYLLGEMQKENKPLIYLDSSVVAQVSTSEFMGFLRDNKSSIFVIEDGEKLLKDRQCPALSTILNATDGLLGDFCQSKFIFTFNCSVSEIDSALLRKGRMDVMYEFKELCVEKAKQIWDGADKAMTLAELYNREENRFGEVTKKKVGF